MRRPERRSSLLRRAMMEIMMAVTMLVKIAIILVVVVRMTIIYSDGVKN